MKIRRPAFILPIIIIFFSANLGFAARTELISRSPDGAIGNGKSEDPSISDNARYVVYESNAKNLVKGKTTSHSDIFLYDRVTKKTVRISETVFDESNSSSDKPEISADGNVIVFASTASNLVGGDTEGNKDIFAYDRMTKTLSRVSVNSSGVAANEESDAPDVSGDGRYVVFQSEATNLVNGDTNNQVDIFRHDRVTGNTIRVSYDFLDDQVVDEDSEEPVISDDGRFVAFQTEAALVPCDDNNGSDVYLRDLVENTTVLASTTFYGCIPNRSSYHPSISGNGRFVSFSSSATNLTLKDDDNSESDLFIRDRDNSITERISIATNGKEGDDYSVGYGGNISANGRYVVFSSPATTFTRDGNNANDVFARDRSAKKTTREGVGTYWDEGSGDSSANTAVISANGKYIIFDSRSSGLVPGDNNDNWDIFIRDYLWAGPLITDIQPKSGDFKGGTLLTIIGSNFDSGAAVTIDGVPAIKVVVNSTRKRITCITPPHAIGAVELKVTNKDGTSWIYPIGRGNFSGYIYRSMALPFLMLL